MVLVNLMNMMLSNINTTSNYFKRLRILPPSSRISILSIVCEACEAKKDLDSLAYGLSRLRYSEKRAQRINETYPPVGQSVDMLKMIARINILFLLALRHLWVNLLCTLTIGSRYCEKPEEFNPNRRTEFKTIYQDSLLSIGGGIRGCVGEPLLRNGQCIGLDPAFTLRPKFNECNLCAIVSYLNPLGRKIMVV